MIRVGFILTSSVLNWNGGINYYSNLFRILTEQNGFQPVLMCAPELKKITNTKFSGVEVHYYKYLSNNSIISKIRKAVLYLTGHQLFIDMAIEKNNVDVISHNDRFPLNANTKVPSCSWIPDFQSHHYPELVSIKAKRREEFLWNLIIKRSTFVILSSNDSKRDMFAVFPQTPESKAKILNFALPPLKKNNLNEIFKEKELERYKVIPYNYYVISNQFWAHKNHIIIARALKVLQEKYGKTKFKIIATGLTYDPRGMATFNSLVDFIKENNLKDIFIITGDIPYNDVQLLQHYCMAIIQPSLFEGWNTTVEESKLIGKKILLSNINVHLEQAPVNVSYFNPYDENELAELMKITAEKYNREIEIKFEQDAKNRQIKNWEKFSSDYINIINNTLQGEN